MNFLHFGKRDLSENWKDEIDYADKEVQHIVQSTLNNEQVSKKSTYYPYAGCLTGHGCSVIYEVELIKKGGGAGES